MTWLNLSGTLSVLRLFKDPSLCLPHHTASTFNSLPIPLSKAFSGDQKVDIKAVVLDKDNCFAIPHENEIYAEYKSKFAQLRAAYPGARLLIVSNTAGTASDKDFKQAKLLEKNTGVAVLRHATKKPGCHAEVLEFFRRSDVGVTKASQVAIVGDRLLTDVMMANTMGAHGFWIRDGVAEAGVTLGWIARTEGRFADFLSRRGYAPQSPQSPFE